ncbi:MAG: CBS domain-containing protein, partial [Terriglobia bacterium]
ALMTTEYIGVDDSATLAEAVKALKSFEGSIESVNQIFLVSAERTLTGAVPLARVLLAQASTTLKELSTDPVISVKSHGDAREVIDLFYKYNLVALPVVDDVGHLLGVVTADDVLELVVKRR